MPSGLAKRARMVLLAADGMPNAQIARTVGVSRPTVISWRDRYQVGGIAALHEQSRSGAGVRDGLMRVVPVVLELPEGVQRWDWFQIGAEMFLSRSTIKSEAMSIYRKLGVSSRSQAVARSVELGLLAR